MAPIWTFGALVIHHRWLSSAASTMLDAEHNFARPVLGGKEVAIVASVKPRSKPAGDTTCKTDTRVWPRRTSNKLQWADVFCKLHTSYVSSIHTSCMAPRRGYDPWPLVHRLRLRMPHGLPNHASRLVFRICRKSSWRFSSIVSKRAKSASMAGHNPAPSPQIFSSHSSTAFCCSSVILVFLRLKKFRQNFKSLSVLLRLLLKHASRLGFLICFSSSSRLANMASNRAKSMSSASLQSLRSQSIRVAFWSAVTDFSILL